MRSSIAERISGIVHRRVKPEWHRPTHMPDQYDYLQSALKYDDPDWVIMLDAGRYDIFDQLVWDYFDGQLERVWNGGVGYTGDWFERNLSQDYPNAGLFSYLPLRFQQGDYDGLQHFARAPDIGNQVKAEERLANLGYLEAKQSFDVGVTSPSAVNSVVRDTQLSGGLVRYLKPHPPFVGMEERTSGSGKMHKTQDALETGKLGYDELTDAYIKTYRMGFEAATELVPDVHGTVYLTADHGTCLTCGQLFHGSKHEKHDHLTVVPWFTVDTVL